METREAFKKVVHFAKWEYREKRPKSVKVLRLKSKSAITLGVLPEFQMRTIGPIIYIVVSDRGDELMIYFFNRNGERIGGQHYEPTQKFMKKLKKSTIMKYKLPKKERKEMVDPTLIFQQEFSKVHQSISNTLGITHKYTYTVLVDKSSQFNLTSLLGSKRVQNKLYIPQQVRDKNYLELLASVEWFYTYLTSLIPKPNEMTDTLLFYDLAILLSGVFNLKFLNKISALKLLLQKITIQKSDFNLTESVNLAITSLSKADSQKKLMTLLKKYCNMLRVLKRYKISLSVLEFTQLFIFTCEMFNTGTHAHIFYTGEKEEIKNYFYFKVFSKAHDLTKQFNIKPLKPLEYKTYFLSMLFGLNILSPDEISQTPYTFPEVIKNIGILIKNPYIYKPILKINDLASDVISDYIFWYLKCKMQHTIDADTLDVILEIWNTSNYMLQDFVYELKWKPKRKIQLVQEERNIQSQDLDDKVRRTYLFKINNKGSISFFCQISFNNPLFLNEKIDKIILVQKINLT